MRSILVMVLMLAASLASSQTRERYVVTDYLGSVFRVYADNGLRLEQVKHLPYGEKSALKDDAAQRYAGYTGGTRAAELVDLGDRHYSPALRRFVSPDPIGHLAGGYDHLGQYHYAGNNPMLYVDRNGQYLDIAIEIASIGAGLTSMGSNISDGNYGDAAADAGFVVLDAVLIAVPGIPGGTGLARQGIKQAAKQAEKQTLHGVDNLADYAHNYQKSVGASQRIPNVLQTGGNKLTKSTAKALNEQLGENLTKRDWGRALEGLKSDLGLPADHHARIMDNGDYVDDLGNILGNMVDYLP